MSEWHGYILMELTITLSAPQKINVRDALRSLANTDGYYPDKIMAHRFSLANDKILVECYFPNGIPTKAQFVTALSNQMGISQTTINNALSLTVFSANGTRDQSLTNCRDNYLIPNLSLWEVLSP